MKKKIGIPLHTPVLQCKGGVNGGIIARTYFPDELYKLNMTHLLPLDVLQIQRMRTDLKVSNENYNLNYR